MAILKRFWALLVAGSFIVCSNAMLEGKLDVGFKSPGSQFVDGGFTGDFSVPGKVYVTGNVDMFENKYRQAGCVFAIMKNAAPVKLVLVGDWIMDAEKQCWDCTYEISGEFPMGFNSPTTQQPINISIQCMGTFSHINTVTIKLVPDSGLLLAHVMAAIRTEGCIDVIMENGNAVPLNWVGIGKAPNSFVYSVVDIPHQI